MLNIFINLLLVAHILVCLLIVLAVLMQRPKNEGLGAAFGAGTADSLFGAQTTNVLAAITRWLGGLFFGLTLILSALYARQGRERTDVEQKLQAAPKPVEASPALPAGLPDVKLDGVPTPEAPKPAPEAPKPAPEAPKPAHEAPKPAPEAPKPAPEAPKPNGEAKAQGEPEKLLSLSESLLRG